MIVKFTIENNVLKLAVAPKQTMRDALTIVYGDIAKMDQDLGHYPAITHDVEAGRTDYDLPPVGAVPGFSVEKITEVSLDDRCLDVIKRYGS